MYGPPVKTVITDHQAQHQHRTHQHKGRHPLAGFDRCFDKVENVVVYSQCGSAGPIKLELPEIKGELKFSDQVKWPSKIYSPGVMGPYSFGANCPKEIMDILSPVSELEYPGYAESWKTPQGGFTLKSPRIGFW